MRSQPKPKVIDGSLFFDSGGSESKMGPHSMVTWREFEDPARQAGARRLQPEADPPLSGVRFRSPHHTN
jgi:hypothetical protein